MWWQTSPTVFSFKAFSGGTANEVTHVVWFSTVQRRWMFFSFFFFLSLSSRFTLFQPIIKLVLTFYCSFNCSLHYFYWSLFVLKKIIIFFNFIIYHLILFNFYIKYGHHSFNFYFLYLFFNWIRFSISSPSFYFYVRLGPYSFFFFALDPFFKLIFLFCPLTLDLLIIRF